MNCIEIEAGGEDFPLTEPKERHPWENLPCDSYKLRFIPLNARGEISLSLTLQVLSIKYFWITGISQTTYAQTRRSQKRNKCTQVCLCKIPLKYAQM